MQDPGHRRSLSPARALAATGLLALGLVLAATTSRSEPARSKLDSALAALEASDYGAAERDFAAALRGPARGAALLGRARVELATGRYAEAARSAYEATQADRTVALEAACVRAEALEREGKIGEAASLLESVQSAPTARRARLLLGSSTWPWAAAPRPETRS